MLFRSQTEREVEIKRQKDREGESRIRPLRRPPLLPASCCPACQRLEVSPAGRGSEAMDMLMVSTRQAEILIGWFEVGLLPQKQQTAWTRGDPH